MRTAEPARPLIGWDIGGAHVKACLVDADGTVRDIAQWPCPLWQGLQHLDAALAQAQARWPVLPQARHAATMTGEMVDLFADRADGVQRLSAHLAEALGPTLRLYAGVAGARWVAPHGVTTRWADIASANWRATAEMVAVHGSDAVLVDVGSTTTDIVPVRAGRLVPRGTSDAERLASGALVYQGAVRTPLCALAPRVPFGGVQVNVMNEFFATTADVYRLTGELDAAHDQQPAADGGAKDAGATRQRLARMIGRDARDASEAEWLALAGFWRSAQHDEIASQLARACADSGIAADAPLVAAGCGEFVVAALAARLGRPWRRFSCDVAGLADTPALTGWAQVCAPAVAVACLAARG